MASTALNLSRINVGISDCGQVMGRNPDIGLASVEPEGVYEHLAIGVFEEGYTFAYKVVGGPDVVAYDVFQEKNNINCLSDFICRNDKSELVKTTVSRTTDDLVQIRNTFIVSKNGNRIIIQMEFTNCSERSQDLEDILIKRYADLDVDTGGSAGWAGYRGRWDKNRYSVFSYNLDSDAPDKRRSHVVNMVAMPSDLPLDTTFVGQLGKKQYKERNNTFPLTTPTSPVDGCGILQWRATRLLPGEKFRINMYYDTFRSFAK